MRISLTLVLLPLIAASPVLAADKGDAPTRVTAGVTVGTLGVGPELSIRPSWHVGVRANAGFIGISHDENIDDINYDGKLKLNSYGLLLDVYPFGGGFRISAGARYNRNRIDLVATPLSSVSVGSTVYTPAQIGTLAGTVRVKKITPQLTIGYGGTLKPGLTLGVEAGVVYQGRPSIDDLSATGLLASDPRFQADLAAEQAKIEAEIDDYKFHPVLQISAAWRF